MQTKFINIDFYESKIKLIAKCGYCGTRFRVENETATAWIWVAFQIECPICVRRYDFDQEQNHWISDRPLGIIENESVLIMKN